MLKLTLLALLLSSVTAQTTADKLGPGESKCTCALPGGSGKCDKGTGNARWEVCGWQQECYTASNISYSMCIKIGNQVCTRHRWLGTSGSIVKVKEAHPTKLCCEEEACTSRQACVEKEGGTGTFEYEYANSDGGTTKMMQWTLDEIARHGWKTKDDKAFKNRPKVCIDRIFDATQAAKQVIAPGLGMIFAIVMSIVACCKRQTSILGAVIPMFVIATAFFLCISEFVAMALFVMLLAAATIATPSDHMGKLVIFQITFVWLFFGGTNFFFAIGDTTKTSTLDNYFTGVASNTITELETHCSKHFDKFYDIVTKWKAWDVDSTMTTWGLCDRRWLSFLILDAYANAFALFLMVALTTLSYLSPGMKFRRGKGGTAKVESSSS